MSVVDGRLIIGGHTVCPECLEDVGTRWCDHDPRVEFATAWAEYLAAAAPTHTVGYSRGAVT
jgi:hypothetical protein